MGVLGHISDLMIPIIIFMTVGYGMAGKVKVYEAFLKGAGDGLKTVVQIVPTLIGLMTAVGILRASGFFDFAGMLMTPVTTKWNLPPEIVTLLGVKMFSSSASTGLVLDIFKKYGPDSYTGMLASILMSCTETCFYTMSVYFLAAKVSKTKYTLSGALWAALAGTIASLILAGKV